MKIYIDVFMMGVALGMGPCLSFCAPILIPYIAATQKNWLTGLKVSLAFSFARIIPYVILSLFSASLGQYLIRRFYAGERSWLPLVVAGGFISLLGIFILIGKSPRWPFCSPFKKAGGESLKEMALLGLMVGFAPCLPLVGLLTYIAFNSQNLLHGALLGLSFGLGTIVSPLILLGPVAGAVAGFLLKKPLIYKIFSRACGLILIYLGVSMVLRAFCLL